MGSMRTDPDPSGPIRTDPEVRIHSESVRIHSGPVRIHSGPVRIHSGPVRTFLSFGISCYRIDAELYGPIWTDTDRHGPIWIDPDPSRGVRTHSELVRIHSESIIDHVYHHDYVKNDPK